MIAPSPDPMPRVKTKRVRLRSIVDLACLVSIVASLWIVSRPHRSSTLARRNEPALREDNWVEAVAIANFSPTGRTSDTVVVISDYQCGGCRLLHTKLTEWVAREGVTVAVGTVHYPLAYHPHAKAAALAALCAESLGAYKSVHEALMDSTESVDQGRLMFLRPLVPRRVRPDFVNCIRGGAMEPALERHVKVADAVGVEGTPTLLVNGWRVKLPNGPPDLVEWARRTRSGRSPY